MNVILEPLDDEPKNARFAMLRRIAQEEGVPEELFTNLASAENAPGDPYAVSKKGARGLLQVIPSTAQEVGVDPNQLHDPEQNARAGARYLKKMLDRYQGDPSLSVAAYNAGPGAVDKYGGIPPYKETQNHVKKVVGSQPAQEINDWQEITDWQEVEEGAKQAQPTGYSPIETAKENFSKAARLLTRDKGTVKEALPFIRPLLELGGATAGGVLAAPANIVAPGVAEALGVGGGYLIGNQAANRIQEYANSEKPSIYKSLGEIAHQAPDAALMAASGPAADFGITKAAQLIGKVAKPLLGRLSGTGTGAVDEAIQSGRKAGMTLNPLASKTDFDLAMRGKISGDDVVANAKEALQSLKNERAAVYQEKLARISENTDPIDIQPFKDEVTEALKKFVRYKEPRTISTTAGGIEARAVPSPTPGGGYVVETAPGKYFEAQGAPLWFGSEAQAAAAAKSISKPGYTMNTELPGAFDWARTTVGPLKETKKGWTGSGSAKELKTLYDQIMSWGSKEGDLTPKGLDELKRYIDQFYSDKSDIRAFTANARKKLHNIISENVPEYREMTKGYSEATNLIGDMEAGLMLKKQGMTGRVVADQTLRRLMSSMKDNFSLRKELVDTLGAKAEQDLSGQIAGYTMRSPIPVGLAGVGPIMIGEAAMLRYVNPKLWPILVASSPRVQGEFLRMFGKAMKEVQGSQALTGRAITYGGLSDSGDGY